MPEAQVQEDKPTGTTREVSKDELNRYIDEAIQNRIGGSVETAMRGLQEDVLGKDRAEEITTTREKARSDFAALSATEQNRAIKRAKSSLFDGRARAFHVENRELPEDLQRMGWGTGSLFQRGMLLYFRAQRENRNWEWCVDTARANGNDDLAHLIEQRVLQAGDLAGAGALVPEVFSTDFISALYARSIVRLAGARVLDISERGNLSIGRQNATATGYWIGENESTTASEGTYGQLKLDAKKLGVFVPVSNDAIRYAVGDYNALVADDMVTVAALKEDLAFLRGDGANGQPKGLRNWANSNNVIDMNTTGADDFEKQSADLLKLQFRVENSDVSRNTPAWLMSVREKYGLMLTKTSGGEGFAFRDEMVMNGTLMAEPFYATSQLPTNLDNSGDGNNDESEFFYAEMSQVVIGDAVNTEIEANPYGSYTDSGSNRRDAFQRDEMVLRLIHQVDLAVRHDEAVAYVQDASYGSSFG